MNFFTKTFKKHIAKSSKEIDASTMEGLFSLTVSAVMASLTGNIYANSNGIVFFTNSDSYIDHLKKSSFAKMLAMSVRKRSRVLGGGYGLDALAKGIEKGNIQFRPLSEAWAGVKGVDGVDGGLLFDFIILRSNLACTLYFAVEARLKEKQNKVVRVVELGDGKDAYRFGRESESQEQDVDILMSPDLHFLSRYQGKIFKENGRWFIMRVQNPKMSIEGIGTLDLGDPVELTPRKGRTAVRVWTNNGLQQTIFEYQVHEQIEKAAGDEEK